MASGVVWAWQRNVRVHTRFWLVLGACVCVKPLLHAGAHGAQALLVSRKNPSAQPVQMLALSAVHAAPVATSPPLAQVHVLASQQVPWSTSPAAFRHVPPAHFVASSPALA